MVERKSTSRLYFEILDFILKHCRAQSHEHLSERLSCGTDEVETLLSELARTDLDAAQLLRPFLNR